MSAKRASYNFKRAAIAFAENNGNHIAAAEFGVDRACNIRWRKQRDQIFKGAATLKKFTGPCKGRHFELEEEVYEFMAGVSTKCFYGKKKRSPTAVLIPQGDVSDIDLDDSDDDEENVAKLTTSKKLGCHEGSLPEIGLDVEIDGDEEDGSADNAGFARAGASGFIYGFDVYVGKKTISQPSELGISGDIVLKLTEPLPSHKGFKVAFDNWFTSHGVIVALQEKGLLSVGTARVNRLPGCSVKTDAALKKSGRGSFDVCTEVCNNIAAVKWLDNKPVHLVSSYIGSEPVDQVQRWSATTRSHVTVQQPAIVKEYNRFMGGVDLCNMLVELYRCDIRGLSAMARTSTWKHGSGSCKTPWTLHSASNLQYTCGAMKCWPKEG
ncbi:hypothetical protein MTO96_041556 [Rhipicephalus appendiculatus]